MIVKLSKGSFTALSESHKQFICWAWSDKIFAQSEDETEDSFLSNWRRSGLSYTQAEAEAGDSAWDSAVADLTGTK